MTAGDRVGIIGAGIAGLATAKVLGQAGYEVVVFDKAPDIGGVWSRTRRYPGLVTQNPRDQYAFSDFPMPKDFPEWPSGEQVQAYLTAYAQAFRIPLRLGTEVTAAYPSGGGWTVETDRPESFDQLVVCNGVFSQPDVPAYPGRAEFEAAGGRLCAGPDFHDTEEARGRHVLVVGYGKSACDITVPISEVAASTSVVARTLVWKMPRWVGGLVNYKMLLLTRLGEALFRSPHPRGLEKFLHGPANRLRRRMINGIGDVSVRQFGLDTLGLVPPGQMEDIVRGASGLATEGFFEGVAAGTIRVHRDRTVVRLLARDSVPSAELSDGTVLPADLVVCATGYTQDVPFLPEKVRAELFDERGNFLLYRQIRPVDVPGLYFNGYASSFFCTLNTEMAAVWIAADLAGALRLPEPAAMRRAVIDQVSFLDHTTGDAHCRGTKIIPLSLHNVDQVLGDLNVNIPARTRAAHWLIPVDPRAYREITPTVLRRLARGYGAAPGLTRRSS
ncbi:flavin-containing monooxygenase [Actinophytocola oryzae]|uniref:Cation diffusion facilitator CzcD-associated flavoprotein CzcO n=1 Tax=Actinophytocola oryzae TaxID=502181 RepID=A0A4V3FQU2_9PSEU|nr:NAD(P)/FAD-dependent oxidoreductase [Actinophytocola oryzae]TDV41011.1 cation diffusion facilitator CzcD-associated flavoprotein CzcO [Actinophytocola oryzae]